MEKLLFKYIYTILNIKIKNITWAFKFKVNQ